MAGDGHSIIPQKSRALCRFNAELIKRYVIPAIIHGCLSKPSPPPRGNGEAASENEPVSYRLETSPMHGCVGLVRRVKYSAFPAGFASDTNASRSREKEKLIIGEGWMPALDATARRLRLSWNITLIKPSWKKRERNNFLGRSWEWKAIAIIVRPARQPISCLPLLSLDFASLQRITLDVGKDCRFGKDLSRSRIRNFGEGWIRILFVWFRLINRKCSFKE